MANIVTFKNVTEVNPNEFCADASDIGITAGSIASGGWPTYLKTDIGNKMPFVAVSKRVVDGGLLFVRYRQSNGCIDLVLFND
jgi:hypothetical protein